MAFREKIERLRQEIEKKGGIVREKLSDVEKRGSRLIAAGLLLGGIHFSSSQLASADNSISAPVNSQPTITWREKPEEQVKNPQKSKQEKNQRLIQLSPIVDLNTVGTPNPIMIENPNIPIINIKDIESGLAARSIKEQMKKDGFIPFKEEALQRYNQIKASNLSGLVYGYRVDRIPGTDFSVEYIRNKNGLVIDVGRVTGIIGGIYSEANWQEGGTYNNSPMKYLPYKLKLSDGRDIYPVGLLNSSINPNDFIVIFTYLQNQFDYPSQPFQEKNFAAPSIIIVDPNDNIINKIPPRPHDSKPFRLQLMGSADYYIRLEGMSGVSLISIQRVPQDFERRIFPVITAYAKE